MDYLYNNRVERYEYELLTPHSGSYRGTGTLDNVSSGRVTMDFSRNIVTTATFTLRETGEINYLTDRIRPWYCLKTKDGEIKWPLGTFLLMAPSKSTEGVTVERDIKAYDPLYVLDQDKVDASFTVEEGSNVVNAIEDIIDSAGERHLIEPADEGLRSSMVWEVGTSKLEIVNDLLSAINYYPLWSTGRGRLRGIPWKENLSVIWEFADNEEGLYEPKVSADIDYSGLRNKIIVVADQLEEDTPPLTASATLEDIGLEDHPFSYTNIGRHVTEVVTSESTSQDYINNRAKRVLKDRLEVEEVVSYSHAFVSNRNDPGQEDGLPWRGDGFRFRNDVLDLRAVYRIESQEISLQPGALVNSTIRRFR